MRALCFLLLIGAGCSGHARSTTAGAVALSAVAVAVAATTATSHESSPPLARKPELPPRLEPPLRIACTFRTSGWSSPTIEDESVGEFLRFRWGAPEFAQVSSGAAVALSVPVGSASGAYLTVETPSIRVRGYMERQAARLYPARAFVLSGVFVPNGRRALSWSSADADRLSVVAGENPNLHAPGGGFSGQRPCADLTLDRRELSQAEIERTLALPPAAHAPRPVVAPWLGVGKSPLAERPGGVPVGVIDFTEPPDHMLITMAPRVLEAGPEWSRVVFYPIDGTLSAWVPNTHLILAKRSYVDFTHDDRVLVVVQPEPRTHHWLNCNHDLTLIAEAGGERRTIGELRAGPRFERMTTRDGFIRLELGVHDGVFIADKASFWVREADTLDCEESTSEP
jgi:hypothetical protein